MLTEKLYIRQYFQQFRNKKIMPTSSQHISIYHPRPRTTSRVVSIRPI